MSRHALNTWTMALIFVSIASAQPDTLWTKTYGTAGEELLYSIDQTADGGFVMSGITGWGTGSDDYWLVRTDASGDTIWTRTYGGPGADETQSGQLTTDGGYIMAGLGEMWLIRTNENGDTLWTLRSGGPGGSESPHVALTNDGGYIITGNFPDEVNHAQVGIVKVDDLGNILWTKTYGDPDDEFGSFVQPTADNGYVILGYKDITYPNHEFWLLKTDAAGDTTWTTVIPTANGEANVVRQTADGGYAIFGLIFGTLAAPDNDAPRDWLLIKTDASGNVDWSQTYGSLGDDQSMDMIITDDDGFLLTGWSHQTDLEDADLWLVQTDTSGAEVWDTFVGSTGMDIGIGLVQIADGEYAITGGTGSWGAGGFDGWLVRFGAGPDPFEQDSLALVDLYNSTDGANWMNPWTLTDPVSTWGGVTVTDGRVTSLYLYDNKLDGTIPASIGTLTALTILQIAGNYTLSGPIPIEIGNLTSLTSLEFNNNQLNGEIPSEIGYLTALTSLNLYGNYQITGSIPASIGNLTNLTSISLARNELTGAIPSTIGDMTSLQSLSLNENQLSDAIPSEIGNLTSLTYLALYSNQLTGSIPTTIATLDNLTGLNFYDNLLTGSIPTFIGSMTNLTSIRLNNNGFSGAIPDEISSLTNLTYLDLSENQLTGAVPPEFSALAVLVTLDLSQNQLTGLPDLSGLPLAHLILHNNRFTFEDLEPNVDVSDIIYSPQYWVGTVIDTTVEKGTSLTLTASVGGTANHYQWREGVWDIEDSTATTFTFESLDFDDDGVYTYRVTNDIVTGLTLYSHPITITVADTTPPAVPQNLTAEAAGDEARLTWDQNSEPDFRLYRVYGGITTNPTTVIDSITTGISDTTIVIRALIPDVPYYFSVTAVDVYYNESDYSNVVSVLPSQNLLEIDSLALVVLYDSTAGTNWADPWNLGTPVSSWSGVIVINGRVTSLSLSSRNLTGVIPAAIGDLTSLTYLELGWNQLTGSIPVEIGDLTGLTYLSLGSNQLTGEIPDAIGNLTNLTELWFHDTQLSGTIPDTLRNLTGLTILSLAGNLTGPLPDWLGSLTDLTTISIYNNELSGSIPTSIENLTNLTDLFLANNGLTGSIPVELGSLTNLTNLSLNSNQLSGAIPDTIGNLTNLTSLTLNDNQLSGPIPASMGNMSSVVWLWLMNNQLSGEIPAELGNLASVQYLYLNDNQLSGAVPIEIANATTLKQLNLGNNQLDELPDLTGLSALDYLWVPDNRFTFEDIEPNIGISGFTYAPQDSIGVEQDTTVFEGNPLTLSVVTGGLSNQYRWKQEGVWITELSGDSSYTISAATFEDIGRYNCTITNTIATGLDLFSRPVHVNVIVDPFEADSLALVALYNSTDGANWTDNTSWLNPDSALSSWYGVTVYNNRVAEVRLRDNNLSGTLPPEIGDLTELETLDLGNDSLTGIIPTEIGNLTKLGNLTIINSKLTGPIPPDIGNLVQLGSLSLGGNQLTGPIPPQIGNLINLWNISLEVNQLTGPIPSEIGNLINLTRFSAWENALSDSIPPSIGNLTSLTVLTLCSNQLTGPIPSEIGNDTNLTWLNLADNQLTGPIPGDIGNLTHLDNLYLSANLLSGTLPPEIGNLTSCVYLYLQINKLSGPIPAQISGLTSVTNLELGHNEFTSLPPEIANLTGLTNLSLDFNLLDSVPDLSPMSSLSFFLVNNNRLTFEDVIPLLGLPIGYVQYAPQDSVGTALDTIIDVGASLTLSVDVGGEGNLYTWKRGYNVESNQSPTNSFTISDATVADAGVYHCEITNPGADQLTLVSQPMRIGVGGPLAADDQPGIPDEFALRQNYPNPFNPVTTLTYDLPEAADVSLVVYDMLGREVVQLVRGRMEAGYRQVIWTGRTASGRGVPSGIYLARLITPKYSRTIKMLLLK